MADCGCSGIWKVRYLFVPDGQNYEFDQPGFQRDNPTYQNIGGTGQIISSCDNRSMVLITFTFTSVTNVTFEWIPGPDCQPQDGPYDCLNGICIEASRFNTPGLYESLSECQIACGTGCSGKCLPSEEWAKIEGLTSQIRNKSCK